MARPMTAEVIVELPTGARVGVVTAERAAQLYPGATILSYGDGRPFEGPAEKPLGSLTRAELNRHAATAGIAAPETFANKAELIAAIEASRSDPDAAGTVPDTGETGDDDQG